jgi:lysozyme
MIIGFDVSRYEVVNDWDAVKAAGYCWGSTRASVGDYYTDPTFEAYWAGMRAAKILRTAYHVITPDRPKEQINRFIDLIKDDVGELPPAVDVELDRGQSRQTITECVRHAVVEIQNRLGRTPLVYVGKYFYQDFMLRLPVIEACPLWIPNYTTAPLPGMPVGWKKWTFWQYTEGGKIPGIQGATDLNWFNGTMDELLTMANQPYAPVDPRTFDQAVYDFILQLGYTGPKPT